MKIHSNRKSQKGFTLIELLIVIKLLALVCCIFLIPTANFWYTEAGVERELKRSDNTIVEVLSTERNIIASSRVLVRTKYATMPIYCLDTNVLYNYTFTPCSK